MSSENNKRPALGRGLSALLENAKTELSSDYSVDKDVLSSVAMLPIDSIETNPFNPRTNFDDYALDELKNSIITHGIIQPLTVRKLGRNKYQIISGERRFRASQLAGLKEIPAYIRLANDQTMLEMALVENLQRENLNPIEIALSYQRLIQECDLTQERLAQQMSKSRTAITNHLRLLKLPPSIQLSLKEGEISMGHARALVGIENESLQQQLFDQIRNENLSVREVENAIREQKAGALKKQSVQPFTPQKITFSQQQFADNFTKKVASKVQIKKQPSGAGKLIINFSSEVDLNRIIEILNP